ncbi:MULTISPECIES: single-stranded DNA-binding protein [Bifidobacterium]|uniref:Single-stranded DNA-binding protein n=1 Tax=Bifidobacterium tissieri TaxID=1630162 RepID=A0A5M9ZJ13_9BIFI|nr:MULTISPECIES: single-stranded DNA-binding protein [Bifidobacterium]KAA8827576.1 single-stranded DNA-binding protein [Bifidobacterium tissieri]KAA8830982.1 single-stranded DNA-binding protein [Bifidobacterium tissieri]TPF97778.1 single-stranded DNA-binding protein [Bifidobacterium sp. UTCIF-39]
MAGDTVITVVGNLTADPELRTIPSGATVANFTIASTPRTYNRQSGQWEDGEALFLRCSAWDSNYNPIASNIQASLAKGMRVIAQGRLTQRSYTANDGSSRTVVELRVDEIGPALSRNTAQVTRNNNGGNGGYQGAGQGGGFAGAPRNNAASSQGGYQGGYSGGYSGGYQGGGAAQAAPAAPQSAPAPAADPWSSGADASGSYGSFGATNDFGGGDDEPEF